MTKRSQWLARGVLLAALTLAACSGDASEPDPHPSPRGDEAGPLGFALALGSPVSAGGPIPLTVTLRNESDAEVTVARPAIVPSMVFLEVTSKDGGRVPFDGPYPRLRPLNRDSFVELAAGESVEHTFDLAAFYSLPAGSYTVVAEYRNPQDGAHHGLDALVIASEDGVRSNGVDLEVQ